MILKVYGEEIQCDKAIKGENFIKVFRDGDCVLEHNGINDFSGYNLTDEDGNPTTFSIPEPTETDRLRALESAMLAIMMGGTADV